MTKYFERVCTRLGESSENVKSWAEGESKLGLNNSLFICEQGNVTQYVDSEEGEAFNNMVSQLTKDEFNNICDEFFQAIEDKDLAKMHKGLAIFNEMDNYNFGDETMKRRLLRLRKSTESESYKFKQSGETDFICYKGEIYTK